MKRLRTFSLFLLLCTLTLAAAPATHPADLAGESHQIENVARHDLLRPRNADSANGTPIVLYPAEDWRCMTWKLELAGEDVRLINYFTHKTFYPDAATAGAPVTQHPAGQTPTQAEKWRFVPAGDNVYQLRHVASGRMLSLAADGSITIADPSDAPQQQWKLLDKPATFTG